MSTSSIRFDPVLVIGSTLSVAIGVVFFVWDEVTSVAFATFAGLLGGSITLQLEMLLRDKRRAERESRMGSLITKIESVPWMADLVESMVDATVKVDKAYPETPALDACQTAFEKSKSRLEDLAQGRFQRPFFDNTLNIEQCRTMQDEFLATSFPDIDLAWWEQPDGQRYWKLQKDAIQRGVTIRRVFIHSGWTESIRWIAETQRSAGVQISQVRKDKLPPNMQGIVGLWDGSLSLNTVYNAAGEGIRFEYSVAHNDIGRIRQQFETVEMLASDIDEARIEEAAAEHVTAPTYSTTPE